MANLQVLSLQYNKLRDLSPGLFRDLGSLKTLLLRYNDFGPVRRGMFDGLDGLQDLYIERARISRLEPGALQEMPQLQVLALRDNRLRSIAPGTFSGLDLHELHLDGNPGSPFTFAPTPTPVVPSTASEGRLMEVVIESHPEAPLGVEAWLSAVGGSMSPTNVYIPAGSPTSSRRVEVAPDDDGPVTVRVARTKYYRGAHDGIRVAPGPPVVLYGFPDVALEVGRGGRSFDLTTVFSYFIGAAAEYKASSSDTAVVSADVDGGTLKLGPAGPGTAEVTVTAIGPTGETLTRRFSVSVDVPSVPLTLAGRQHRHEGFVRVINRSENAGTVRISAIDDAGTRHGPVRLRIPPYGAAQFNSTDLEVGNESKRLLEGVGVGTGEGDWRLVFESDLDIDAFSS